MAIYRLLRTKLCASDACLPYLGCGAACKSQALLHFQAWQPVVNYHLPPCPMLEELEGAQASVLLLHTDYKVEQQLLLGADCRQRPCQGAVRPVM